MPALHKIVRRPEGESKGLLVLLHGLGSNEQDLISFAPELKLPLTVVAYRAPGEAGFGGFSWFPIDWDNTGLRVDQDAAIETRDALAAELTELPGELGLEGTKLFLGGFSQGAIMSLGVAFSRPELLSGALLLSAAPMPKFIEQIAPGAVSVPFLVQHGVNDPLLPVTGARQIRDILTELGAPVEYHEYPMGHEVSMQSLMDLRLWLDRRLSSQVA